MTKSPTILAKMIIVFRCSPQTLRVHDTLIVFSLKRGLPSEQVDFKTPLIDIYTNYEWADTWADGNLMEVARYLRGSKRLHLPPEWRAVIPQYVVDEHMED